ncbi:MAG: alpha/beta hydrolase [Solobacterium sp.]|nr:alpha/beta hydrolase [Solobacterium sp.]
MGKIKTFTLDISPLSQSPRKIWVYLPNSYTKTKKKYDVLYMFDGHNLFFDETATYGKCWGLKDYLDKMNLDLVVVGQDCNHEGNLRLAEYCPFPIKKKPKWVKEELDYYGDFTAEWFVKVLKKECEKRFRIYKSREHVGIAGSSMGGLMAAYCITKYNSIFSKAACVSSAIYFCQEDLFQCIQKHSFKDTRIYMDLGSEERKQKNDLAIALDGLLEMNHLFAEKRCETYPHLVVKGTHSESSWESIVPLFLSYLYPHLY